MREAEAMRSPALARAALSMLCGYCLLIGFTALVAPHTFYDDFPFLAHWVERLPPYNEHLVTDVGGLYVGFAVVTEIAALASLLLPPCIALRAARPAVPYGAQGAKRNS